VTLRHIVIDVQVVMIASGLSDPPDDGSARELLNSLKNCTEGRLVWDAGGAIKTQYESKLRPQTFGREWLQELLLNNKIVSVQRCKLTKRQKLALRDTGLVGEDLNYYVRTAASSPDRTLVSHDSDYDDSSRKALRKELDIAVLDACQGAVFLAP
jgi:hypothetical protein